MAEHTVKILWERNTIDFNYNTYSRNHEISFGTAGKICASAAPEYHGDPHCLDPEQAFVMSIASCQMLTFLAIACRKGYVIDKYVDKAVGVMGKNKYGRLAMIKVDLYPLIFFSGQKIPAGGEFDTLIESAHNGCIISNSLIDCVEMNIYADMMITS